MANLKLLLYLYLNEKNKNYFSEKNEIKILPLSHLQILIQSNFYTKKLKSKKNFIRYLPKLKTKGLDIEKDWLKLRAINFVMLCLYINELSKFQKLNVEYLLRSKSKSDLKTEKNFFRKIIYNCKFIKNHERYKYNYIINSKKLYLFQTTRPLVLKFFH